MLHQHLDLEKEINGMDFRSLKARSWRIAEPLTVGLVGIVVGAILTHVVTREEELDRRRTDALFEAYFGATNDSTDISPDDYQLRQSDRRVKFALLAKPSSLDKLAQLISDSVKCDADSNSRDCGRNITDELWLARIELGSSKASDDQKSFRQIIENERKRQEDILLPGRSRPFWVISPVGYDIDLDRLPVIAGANFPEFWSKEFPSQKYTISVQFGFDKPRARAGSTFICSAFAGVTEQPKRGHKPAVPAHYVAIYKSKKYIDKTSPSGCMKDAGDEAVSELLKTPIDTLKRALR